jgi:hypothetical protein
LFVQCSRRERPQDQKAKNKKRELAAKQAAELAELKGLNLSLLTEGKRNRTLAKIVKLGIQVKADELTRLILRSKSLSTGSGASNATRTQFSDEDVTRLIFARTALDCEFHQHVKSGTGKQINSMTDLLYQRISLLLVQLRMFVSNR